MMLVVERDECAGPGAGSQLPATPRHSPVLAAPFKQGVELEHLAPPEQGVEPEHSAPLGQGVEPEHPVSPNRVAEPGGSNNPSGEAAVRARRV